MDRSRFAPSWLTERPIAHRGLHDAAAGVVENTLGAAAVAIARGYAIECDLQETADGEAVVFHDDTLERMSEAEGPVKALTLAEIKRIALRHSQEKIPTLGEFLALVQGQVPLVIEIKPQWHGEPSLVVRVLELLKGYSGRHSLMSFDPGAMAAVRELSPLTVRGVIVDGAQDSCYDALPPQLRQELRCLGFLTRTAPHFLSLDIEYLPWAPISTLRAAGMPIITWTIRSPEQAGLARRFSDQITFEGFIPEC
jgi:glycerophosphoryl diester phosphodiesterase